MEGRQLLLSVVLISSILHASALESFQQNAADIVRGADTNTQEDYLHEGSADTAENSNPLRVFILPHSHDDPGWVRTADQYFNFIVSPMYTTVVAELTKDSARRFQAVEMVYFKQWYDSATPHQQQQTQELVRGEQITFSVGGWVMPDEAITDYPDLVETMALGHQWIFDTFDGARVKHGFQVDPFGASSSFAAISRKLGLETHLVARLNYYDKGWMQDNRQLEFLWRPSPSLYRSEGLEIFTHIMDQYQYSAPGIPVEQQLKHLCGPPHNQTDCPGGGFYWDGDDSQPASYWTEMTQKQGFAVYPGVNNSNVQFYADFMVNNSKSRSNWFQTPNLLWPFGTDFQYSNATAMFTSMDKIIAYVNERNSDGQRYAGITLQYASLQEYFSAVSASQSSGWSVRGGGDFLPYSTLNCGGISNEPLPGQCSGNAGPQYNVSWPQVWSGFYTSHAQLKIQTRDAARELRAADQVLAMAGATHGLTGLLREAVGLLPHHDAVSGTMGPGCGNDPARGQDPHVCEDLPMGSLGNTGEVAKDYAGRLASGVVSTKELRAAAVKSLLHGEQRINASEAPTVTAGAFEQLQTQGAASVAVQNPLGWEVVSWMKLDVPASVRRLRVLDDQNVPVKADLLAGGGLDCVGSTLHRTVCAPAKGQLRSPLNANTLFFRAIVAPLGISAYRIEVVQEGARLDGVAELVEQLDNAADVEVSNPFFTLTFVAGRLSAVTDHSSSQSLNVKQTLAEYESFSEVVNQSSSGSWSLSYSGARSGSYLLHSSTAAPGPVSAAYSTPRIQLVRGKHVTEVRQQFSPRHTQVWRLYEDKHPLAAGYVELQYGLGPLGGNREVVSSFDTQGAISTTQDQAGSTFYTDDNGFQMQRRVYTGERSFPDGSHTNVTPGASYTTALSYYPIVRTAYIRDHSRQLLVLSQQSGGVTSRTNGQIEVMMHRRSLQDDSKGACQCFNDTSGGYANIPVDASAGVGCTGYAVAGTCRADSCPAYAVPMNISTRVEPVHWLLAGARTHVDSRWRQLSQLLNNRPSLIELHRSTAPAAFAPLGHDAALPEQVHVLSLQALQLHGREVRVLRLQNLYELDAHPEPVWVDWKQTGLCRLFGRVFVREALLNGLPGSESSRLKFAANEAAEPLDALGSRGGAAAQEASDNATERVLIQGDESSEDACEFRTVLWPQDIKTFVIG